MGKKRQLLRARKGLQGFLPAKEESTKTISFRLTETEYKGIKKYVSKKGIPNMSEWIRDAVFKQMSK